MGSKIQGLKGGAEDYIVKPFEILELLVRMEKVLERTNKLSQTIKILNMEINFEEHSVKQNGQEVILKPKEFELLSVLAKNKNIAISRENLLLPTVSAHNRPGQELLLHYQPLSEPDSGCFRWQ